METKSKSWIAPQFILGLSIIGIGVLFLVDNLGYFDAHTVLQYWPVIIIVWGISKIATPPGSPGKTFGMILIAFGTLFLLHQLDIMYFRLSDWWPLILVIIGINFLRGSMMRSKTKEQYFSASEGTDTDSFIRHTAVMSGVKRLVASKDFRGGELTAVMGGCEIDFRDAQIKQQEAVLDVSAFWGGIELRVPMNWTVVVKAVPIMGGIEDRTYPSKEGSMQRLIITGNVVMGGVEIKN